MSGDTALGLSDIMSDGSYGILHIAQISSITESSLYDTLISHPGHSLRGLAPCRMKLVYSTVPFDWAIWSCVESL